MLVLTCDVCGVTAEETEFHAGGEAHLKRFGPGSSEADFERDLSVSAAPAIRTTVSLLTVFTVITLVIRLG